MNVRNIMCQWQILDDTSLPLSSSVPGVRVAPIFDDDDDDLEQLDTGGGGARSQRRRPLANDDEKTVHAARLTLSWRFYDFLPRGDNKFACLAYTLGGRRNVQYFTVYKI